MKTLLLLLSLAVVGLTQARIESEILTPPTKDVVSLAISPDGRKVAFVAASQGRQQVWVRDLEGKDARPLPGTEYATDAFPFWSPDSKFLGFSAEGSLRIMDIEAGTIRTLASLTGPFRGGSWGSDGTILLSTASAIGIQGVAAAGGPITPRTRLRPPFEALQVFPSFLPDGRHFLYYALGSSEGRGVYLAQLGSAETVRLMDADAAAVYSAGNILFIRGGTLFSQPFDLSTRKLTGQATEIAQRVPTVANGAAVSASSTGTLVYRTGFATRSTTSSDGERLRIQVDVTEAVDKQFTWFDRSGKELERLGAPTPVDSGSPALSPDGKTVAFARTVEGNTDIWLLDLEKETYSRFTSDPARDNFPYWAPDGRSLVFSSNRNGPFQLLRKPVAGGAEVLLSSLPNVIAKDSLADGRLLVQQTASRVAVLHPNGTLTHVANNIPLGSFIQPQVSPDTRWIAYQSNRSGNDEVYVAPFPLPANYLSLKPVSSKGGAWPIWSRNGRELFYIAPDGALMAVPFNLSSGAGGNAVRLFVPPMLSSVRQTSYLTQYAVSTEGRFLVIGVQEVESPIQVIRNWKP